MEGPETAGQLYAALRAGLVADGVDEGAADDQARQLVEAAGHDGLTEVDRRYENHHRIWVAFSATQVTELEREIL